MSKMKKLLALLLALVMMLTLLPLAAADSARLTESEDIVPEGLGSGAPKWTEETTDDGWIKVINEGGEELLSTCDSEEELLRAYDQFALELFEDDEEENP